MARRDEAAEVGQLTQRALLTVCVLGVIFVVSIGIWLADANRTPLPPEATPKQPLPTPMQVPITPVQSAFSGVLPLPAERELAITPKEGFRGNAAIALRWWHRRAALRTPWPCSRLSANGH
jgi:hypothetical protein